MSLSVKVKSASNLPNVEWLSKSDPFTIVSYHGRNKKTKVIDNNLNPVWDETLNWDVPGGISAQDSINIEVYDYENIGRNRLLGTTEVSLVDVLSGKKFDVTKTLTGMHAGHHNATITLELNYEPPPSHKQVDVVTVEEVGEDVTEQDSIEENTTGTVPTAAGSSKRKTHRTKQQGAEQARHKLADKPTDFQVRVHVLEARKLVGSSLNTSVKVACGKDMQETSTQRGTNNPVFDEILFFNFRERPNQMFDRVTELKVYDAKKVISNALIGSFKFDLGLVYDEVEHCYIHKWLLLTDPYDQTGATKGYLKISIQVLGPGDNPKHSPSCAELNQERVDIEANLLRPAGVRLVPATLTVRVFRGEDLPQMDPSYFDGVKKLLHIGSVKKELVDPYCSVTFAGHKGTTQVIWNEHDPIWNKQINLGVRFPSMCERIRFRLKDKDKVGRDDYIGTSYLHMSEISSSGENGFPPTFGPCFINCYGSPREYSDLPDKYDHLNKGLIEGVAYRGRVMVEVSMTLGKLPTNPTEDVKSFNLKKLTPFLHRRKYKLYGVFFSATMVCPSDQPTEFEVSIGNYGNKLDENSPAQSSTTPPSTPVYDGTNYYYLPWLNKKPVVEVESQWEDCSYRIDSLNLIQFIHKSLKSGLDSVKTQMNVENYNENALRDQLKELLDSFSENIYHALPDLPKQGFTRLDKLTRDHRAQTLSSIRKDCDSIRKRISVSLKNGNDFSVIEVIEELEQYIAQLKSLAYEPQNSVPDVVIWMLSNNKRVAVKRIPSHELMYSPVGKFRGKYCGKLQTINLTPPAVENEEEMKEINSRVQVRLLLWLGLEKDHEDWRELCQSGKLTIFAERYENQVWKFGNWKETGAGMRPHWSDESGKVELRKEAFDPPPEGWRWEGDWIVQPEQNIEFEPEEGRDEWTEEIFENQTRHPLSPWPDEETYFLTDIHGTKLVKYEGKKDKKEEEKRLEEINPPEGWIFRDSDEWKIDVKGAVDEEGWEYTVEYGLSAQYVPFERNVHCSRRRRRKRTRFRHPDSKAIKKKKDEGIKDGWEYASLGSSSFHYPKSTFDFLRRRRYVCKLINVEAGASRPVFQVRMAKKGDDRKWKEHGKQLVPRMYLEFEKPHVFQLRTYLFQARDMYGSDSSGLSDPYAIISFANFSTRSRCVKETLCPTWDQTLIFSQIMLYGDRRVLFRCPPPVVLEFFDEDQMSRDDYLGSCVVMPTVLETYNEPSARLDWVEIVRYNRSAGDVLIACELILLEEGGKLPQDPPKATDDCNHFMVPETIKPKLQKMRIEILCWGVRDMKPYQLLSVNSPTLEVECGGTVLRSQHIKDADDNPNFPKTSNVISFDVNLPKEQLYCPPLNLRMFDKRMFGHQPMVGTHVIKSLQDFFVKPTQPAEVESGETPQITEATDGAQDGDTTIDMETGTVIHSKKKSSARRRDRTGEQRPTTETDGDPHTGDKLEFDWWTKYYCSVKDERRTQQEYSDGGYDQLVVYEEELEKNFENFTDIVQTFPLYRGKGSRDPEDKSGQPIGYFKGSIRVHCPDDDESITREPMTFKSPSFDDSYPVDVVVRVYIIKGFGLQPRDPDGKSDPYIKVKIGKREINDKDNYIPSNLNPTFGKMFELPATLPLDHTLTVSVMDWDRLSADDLIGETKIDLENRYLSRHRATCGLPQSYSERGPNRWRDGDSPTAILDDWLRKNGHPAARWHDHNTSESESSDCDRTMVTVKGQDYTLDMFESGSDKKVHPDVSEQANQRLALHILHKHNLIPEHIEKRKLYTPMQPGLLQGELHMWVDIFEKRKNETIPLPIDISPRTPQKYVLRVVVRNTKVKVNGMTDLYVKGWLRGEDEPQKTDVHYRALDGEGNFNWRLVFPLEYLPAENVMVVKKKEHFYSLTKAEHHLHPFFTMQVWDNDLFTPDDFIGTYDFNLSKMPRPQKRSRNCNLRQISVDAKTDNLFKRKRMEGWWPITKGQRELKGKLELEFEVVTEEESQLHPAAKARDEPNQNPKLDPPNRPKTSFFWLSSPWKTFRFIVWKEYKGRIILLILLLLLLLPIIVSVL